MNALTSLSAVMVVAMAVTQVTLADVSSRDSGSSLLRLADSHGHKSMQSSHDDDMTSHGKISVEAVFARATVSKARNGAAYFTVHNKGKEGDRLIGVRGDVSKRAELHTHVRQGLVLKMRQIESIEIPANGTTRLRPGGNHVMLMGLNAPLKEGQEFPLTLVFEKAGELTIHVKVGSIAAKSGGHGKH